MSYSIIQGDCRQGLEQLTTGSVQTCITSPPYFGLRDYGHSGQLGLEQTPAEFVANLVGVFAEVHRVLANDGTVWLNLGDSYATGGRGGGGSFMDERADGAWQGRAGATGWRSAPPGLKHKDLVGIPWRVAFALQDAGWYLRQDIIWHKPNAMPESVRDRCAKAHEYIFLLSKKSKYYFDAKAIREGRTSTEDANGFRGGAYVNNNTFDNAAGGKRTTSGNLQRKPRPDAPESHSGNAAGSIPWVDSDGLRNRRSVWTVATQPYAGAHFATFPPELIRPCVLAGSRPGDLVLDPFNGSGTTGQVALEEGRAYVGCELNPDYIQLTHKRLSKVQQRLQFHSAA